MLILVSNDDGVHSSGIRSLASSLKKIAGARVVVVAPDRERSATAHSLTIHRPLRVEKLAHDFYAVDGTPTDSVMLAVNELLKKKPDLIVSGINRGSNLGEDVHYSGTVSAAVEGAIMGIPSLAFSVMGLNHFHFDVAAAFARKLAKQVLKEKLEPGVLLNVNVPNIPKSKIKGVKVVQLGRHNYGGIIIEKNDPRGRPYYWIGGNPAVFEDIKDSDCEACQNGYIAVTPIHVDMTYRKYIEKLKKWNLKI